MFIFSSVENRKVRSDWYVTLEIERGCNIRLVRDTCRSKVSQLWMAVWHLGLRERHKNIFVVIIITLIIVWITITLIIVWIIIILIILWIIITLIIVLWIIITLIIVWIIITSIITLIIMWIIIIITILWLSSQNSVSFKRMASV